MGCSDVSAEECVHDDCLDLGNNFASAVIPVKDITIFYDIPPRHI
jgi:hypothetical protein